MINSKIDQALFETWKHNGGSTTRVILKVSQTLDPEKVDFLRSLGASGALVETVLISTSLNREAVEKLSDQNWVLGIEALSGGQYYDPY